MASSKRAGIVAIVGRTNTGKSSLFNVLLNRREAITADEPGTTRDSLWARTSYGKKDFWLIDTAGLKPAEDDFELTIQEQIASASAAADLILVVVEAGQRLSAEDKTAATNALKTKKSVILVISKADRAKSTDIDDFKRLGIKNMFLASATQKTGLDELRKAISAKIPTGTIKTSSQKINISLVGRPNTGKSSLYNALAKKQQAVVAARAGTTRDINRTHIKYNNYEIQLMDTAGIRRNSKIGKGVEYFSALRSLQAIEEADICILLIDVNELSVHLDQKIAGMVKESGKGLIIAVSKWDSVDKTPFTRDKLAPKIVSSFDFVPWAPLVFTSSVSGQNVAKLFELALEVHQNRQQAYRTTLLNTWLKAVLQKHPPAGLKNRQPKLNYMVHEAGNPVPSFKIYGSQTKFLHWSYKRYLEREFRARWPLIGTPIKFWFIEKGLK